MTKWLKSFPIVGCKHFPEKYASLRVTSKCDTGFKVFFRERVRKKIVVGQCLVQKMWFLCLIRDKHDFLYKWNPMCHYIFYILRQKAYFLYLGSSPVKGLIQSQLLSMWRTNKIEETGRWKKLSKASVSFETQTHGFPKLGSNTQLLLCARQRQAWEKSIHIRTTEVSF